MVIGAHLDSTANLTRTGIPGGPCAWSRRRRLGSFHRARPRPRNGQLVRSTPARCASSSSQPRRLACRGPSSTSLSWRATSTSRPSRLQRGSGPALVLLRQPMARVRGARGRGGGRRGFLPWRVDRDLLGARPHASDHYPFWEADTGPSLQDLPSTRLPRADGHRGRPVHREVALIVAALALREAVPSYPPPDPAVSGDGCVCSASSSPSSGSRAAPRPAPRRRPR